MTLPLSPIEILKSFNIKYFEVHDTMQTPGTIEVFTSEELTDVQKFLFEQSVSLAKVEYKIKQKP